MLNWNHPLSVSLGFARRPRRAPSKTGPFGGMGMPSDINTQLIVFRSFAVVICLACAGAIATASDKPLPTFVLRGPQTTRLSPIRRRAAAAEAQPTDPSP